METNSDHRKRSQEQQRRRPKQSVVNSGANPGGSRALFGKLIEKKGGDQRIQNILGRYNDFPMDWNQQVRYLGVSDATPKTPLLDGKQTNPFDSKFSTNPSTSLGNSSTGASSSGSSSRHQVAEPPAGQPLTSIKRDKGRQSSKHTKIPGGYASSSKESSSKNDKSSRSKVDQKEREMDPEGDSKVAVQPTNILRVSKPKKVAIKPYKSSTGNPQKKSSSVKTQPGVTKESKDPLRTKHRPKKSHSSSQLLSSTENPTTAPSSHNTLSSSSSLSTTYPQHMPQTSSSSHNSKKEASVPPPSLAQDSLMSQGHDSSTVPSGSKGLPSFKRTSSAGTGLSKTGKRDIVDKVSEQGESRTESPILSKVGKKKRLKKKLRKDKEHASVLATEKMDTSESPIVQLEHSLSNQVSASSHMTSVVSNDMSTRLITADSDGYESPPVSFKVQLPKQRPNDLQITSSQFVNEETTMDADNVTTMLQELMNPISSRLVTPIPTPIKTRPFEFPATSQLATKIARSDKGGVSVNLSHSLFMNSKLSEERSDKPLDSTRHEPKRPLCSTSSDDDSDDNKNREALATAMSTLNSNLAAESTTTQPLIDSTPLFATPPTHPRQRTSSMCSDSSSGSSSSDDSSTDSSSDSSSESESDGEVNITPTLEKLSKEMSLPTTTITPIKRTPPYALLEHIISPLAHDESANLSPAKARSSLIQSSGVTKKPLISQDSVGFHPVPPETHGMAQSENPSTITGLPPAGENDTGGYSDSSSDSSSDSGSGSDSESSDSDEDQRSDVEAMEFKLSNTPVNQSDQVIANTNLNLSQSSEDGMPFDSTGGFMEDTDFFVGLQGIPQTMGQSSTSSADQTVLSQSNYRSFDSDSTTQPFTVTSQPSFITSVTIQQPISSPVVNQQFENKPTEQTGNPPLAVKGNRKRKKSQASRLKTPRKAPKLTMKEAATLHHHQAQDSYPTIVSERAISNRSNSYSEEGEVSSETEDQSVFVSQSVANPTNQKPPQSYVGIPQTPTQTYPSTVGGGESFSEQLLVRVPLTDLQRVPDQHKPKATVEPYNIRQTAESKGTGRRNTTDQDPPPSDRGSHNDPRADRGMSHDRTRVRSRDGYGSVSGGSRHREEYGRSSYHRDRSNDRPRSHGDTRSNRWERESSRDRRLYGSDDLPSSRSGGRHLNGRGWDRDYIHGDDYWPDDLPHSDYGGERSRGRRGGGNYTSDTQSYPERYIVEARRKKHEADKMQPSSVDKAKAYMDSVVLFMRYGDATEQVRESSANSGAPKKTSAFRTYSETVKMIKFCQNMAGECKPLVVLCMRCQSVLLWRMYILKMPTAASIQKELQEYFIPPKGTQGKSPYTNSSSPLPSPASVGSTTSTGSGGWASAQDPSPSGSVSVPKHIVNKATEHLTISSYVNQSLDLSKTSDAIMDQCRDFFSSSERSSGQRLSHCSPVSLVASWTDKILRNFR